MSQEEQAACRAEHLRPSEMVTVITLARLTGKPVADVAATFRLTRDEVHRVYSQSGGSF